MKRPRITALKAAQVIMGETSENLFSKKKW